MQRIARHLARQGSAGAQLGEQAGGVFHRGGGRAVQPFERVQSARAHGVEQEGHRRQVGTRDFGSIVGRTPDEILQRIQANGAARARCVRRGPRAGWRKPG